MRGLIPELPRDGWILLAGDAVSAVGSGLTLPFLLVYLHQVRGLGLGEAGLALSVVALAGFAGNPAGGSLVDRIGGRAALLVGLAFAAVGSAWLAFVTDAGQAYAAAATLGFGLAVVWPARTALLATVVPVELRSSAYGLGHAAMNIGLGIGALLAAVIVDPSSPKSFQAIYILDAASFVAFVPLALRLRAPVGAVAEDAPTTSGGYRVVFRDRAFLRLWAVTALIVGCGYAQCSAAFPAIATSEAGIDAHQLALAFAANTIAVAVAQLPVLRALRGRRRTSALAAAFAATGIAWTIVLVGAQAPSAAAATAVFALAMAVVGIGETFLSPSAPALANDLAPDALRGRYNGVYTLAWTTGFAAGPALAGAFLAAGAANALVAGLIAACAIGALGSLRLAPHLPPAIDDIDGDTDDRPVGEPVLA
jgi:MFS family permease